MPLIVLDAEHNQNGTTYQANNILSVIQDVADWLVSLSKAREIVAGPSAWTAASFDADSLVYYDSLYWVNESSAVSSDVPGVAAKWVSVSYPAVGGGGSGSVVAELIRGEDGLYYRPTVITVDGIKTVTIDQTPVA